MIKFQKVVASGLAVAAVALTTAGSAQAQTHKSGTGLLQTGDITTYVSGPNNAVFGAPGQGTPFTFAGASFQQAYNYDPKNPAYDNLTGPTVTPGLTNAAGWETAFPNIGGVAANGVAGATYQWLTDTFTATAGQTLTLDALSDNVLNSVSLYNSAGTFISTLTKVSGFDGSNVDNNGTGSYTLPPYILSGSIAATGTYRLLFSVTNQSVPPGSSAPGANPVSLDYSFRTAVPEPGTYAAFLIGGLGVLSLVARARKRTGSTLA